MKAKLENHFQGNYRTFYDRYLPGTKQIGGDETGCPVKVGRLAIPKKWLKVMMNKIEIKITKNAISRPAIG